MHTHLNAIGLVAADLAATLTFYRQLGLDFHADGGEHHECELAVGIRLMLDSADVIRSLHPGWTPGTGGPGVAFAFQADTPAAVDRLYADLTAAGHRGVRAPWDAEWGQRYASLLDPDGNGVDLYAPLDPAG